MTKYFSIFVMAICLPFYSATASEEKTISKTLRSLNSTGTGFSFDSWQTTTTRNQSNPLSVQKPRSIGKRNKNIVALRAEALQISMKHLPRLRPYASNYPRMVRVVRAYWRKHAADPNASRLTNMIMQHVQEKYRFLIRNKLHAGISKGINILKRKLRKS